jgi:hypothetical protein
MRRNSDQEARYPREAHNDAHLGIEFHLTGKFSACEASQLTTTMCALLFAHVEHSNRVEDSVDQDNHADRQAKEDKIS